jgi:DNA-binding NarL/FixJ family response regulator
MSTEKSISVLLVDDHALLRSALQHCLTAEEDIQVVGATENAENAITQAVLLKPDIILMDIDMPGLCCFEAAKVLHVRCPDTRVAFLSAFLNDHYIEQALAVQAWGYIIKTESETTVIQAIRGIADGITYFSPGIQERIVLCSGTMTLEKSKASRASRLSHREVDVLRYLARGLSHEAIAQTMSISKHTVHRHSVSIRRKLNIYDRVELARFAFREGLAQP